MRVGETSGHVQHEVVTVLAQLVRDVDVLGLRLGDDLLLQDRGQHSLDLVLDTRDDEGLAFAHAELELLPKLGVPQSRRTERRQLLLLVLLDPSKRLTLGVNQERVPTAPCHEDAVLNTERVRGEALHAPVSDRACIDEEVAQRNVASGRDAPQPQIEQEFVLNYVVPEGLVERPAVRNECASDTHVTDEPFLPVVELVAVFRPSLSLSRQSVDQGGGLLHLSPCVGSVLFDGFLLAHLILEVELELLKNFLTSLELLLGLVELSLCVRKPGLGQAQGL
mmetsp:Transcript_24822/g.51534  ORF Transcript_24822/g.51534 Transcript_24822/m.51534 type:complete len:279 (+) Transcript_24822:895-1731(+)